MPVITLNGRCEEFADTGFPATVLQLLRARGLEPGAVAVELDGEVVARERYAAARLAHGSVVEIVRFMGGGASAAPARGCTQGKALGRI